MSLSGRVVLVVGAFYPDIADALVDGAMGALSEHPEIEVVRVDVPGALEIPAVIALDAEFGRGNAYVALGCVIRGETYHFEIVCNESARGLMDLAVNRRLPIGNGILTVENKDQAWARLGGDHGHKGADAARACLRLMELREAGGLFAKRGG